jgi:hypothetical protein
MTDKLFKPFVVIALLIGLWLALGARWKGIDDGRYVYQHRTDQAQDVLVDTRTGLLFYISPGSPEELAHKPVTFEVNPLTGQLTVHWAWQKHRSHPGG